MDNFGETLSEQLAPDRILANRARCHIIASWPCFRSLCAAADPNDCLDGLVLANVLLGRAQV